MIGQTWRPSPRFQSNCGKLAIATNTSDNDSIIRKTQKMVYSMSWKFLMLGALSVLYLILGISVDTNKRGAGATTLNLDIIQGL